MSNQTNDLSGPEVIRTLLHGSLTKKGYSLVPLDAVNKKLTDAGITDGGQLAHLTPREVGRLLEADGLIYGELLDFRIVNLGFYISRQVHADIWMVDVETEETLWQDDRKFSTKKVTVDPQEALKEFSRAAGRRVLQNIFKSPLIEESRVVVRMVLETLPNRN